MRKRFLVLAAVFGASIIGASFNFGGGRASASVPGINERVSTDSGGNQVNDSAFSPPAISGDGRYVTFTSPSNQLVSGDTNGLSDIFVKDRQTGNIVRASTSSSGGQMTAGVFPSGLDISENGRFVAFVALHATGLVSGYTSTHGDIFLKDMQTGSMEVVSVSTSGSYGNDDARSVDVSADGRYVVFTSHASNMVSGDANGSDDVFVRDRLLNTTTLLSKSLLGGSANSFSGSATMSCDGAYIAYVSDASDIVSGDTNGIGDVFLADRINNTTKDVTINGNQATLFSAIPRVSCDGSTLIFNSLATNLVTGDTNDREDVFAYDIYNGTIERVSVSSSGGQSTHEPNNDRSTRSVSYDGRYVVFGSDDNGLVSGDTNLKMDAYLRDRKNGTTELVTMRNSLTSTSNHSINPAISADGKYVVYLSDDTGLVSGDTNSKTDVFVSQTGL